MTDGSIKYNCKILPLGTIGTVAIAVGIAMNVTFITIFLGLPALLSTFIMVALMFAILMFLSSEATFSITENNLERILLSSVFIFKKKPQKSYNWNEVKSYKNGTDKGKYRGEFQYLEIKFINGDTWKITDEYGERKAGYDNFLKHFLAKVNTYNAQTQRPASSQPTLSTATQQPTLIKRENTFYESIFGKLFTIAIGIFIVLIIIYGKGYMNGSSTYKLNAVLIPGFLYLFYRTFISNKK